MGLLERERDGNGQPDIYRERERERETDRKLIERERMSVVSLATGAVEPSFCE